MNKYPTFSQRQKIESVDNIIQMESMNVELKNRLWNVLTVFFWDQVDRWGQSTLRHAKRFKPQTVENREVFILLERIYDSHFKLPLDTALDSAITSILLTIRSTYYKSPYNKIYDFIEFVANTFGDSNKSEAFCRRCNIVLEEELSGYRFINGIVCPITSEPEIESIDDASNSGGILKAVDEHIKSALSKFSDRNQPDFRNSIKESISAVEALCRIITDKPDATLQDALKLIMASDKVNIHKALINSFMSAYGYAGDESGIRHALKEVENVGREDAYYWLVTCSAFVNYLKVKCVKAGLFK